VELADRSARPRRMPLRCWQPVSLILRSQASVTRLMARGHTVVMSTCQVAGTDSPWSGGPCPQRFAVRGWQKVASAGARFESTGSGHGLP
jgi:hypothetical protein